MFTSIDKALVAAVMGVLYILNELAGVSFGLDDSTFAMMIGAATPILVWLFPNKPWTANG